MDPPADAAGAAARRDRDGGVRAFPPATSRRGQVAACAPRLRSPVRSRARSGVEVDPDAAGVHPTAEFARDAAVGRAEQRAQLDRRDFEHMAVAIFEADVDPAAVRDDARRRARAASSRRRPALDRLRGRRVPSPRRTVTT
jgi:hypothetical protein